MTLITIDHIDPVNGVLVCGLDVESNRLPQSLSYNARKINRFVPYRTCDYPPPVAFGDTCEFLIGEDWVVCEFGGPEWWEESNRVGNACTKAGGKAVEGGLGIHSQTAEKCCALGQMTVEEQIGIHNPEYRESEEYKQMLSSNGGRAFSEGVGLFSPDYWGSEEHKQALSDAGRKGGSKAVEDGLGIHSTENKGKRSDLGRSTSNQRWMCLVTGYISNAGGLTAYQKARGIDTSRRVRLTPEEVAFIFAWDTSVA